MIIYSYHIFIYFDLLIWSRSIFRTELPAITDTGSNIYSCQAVSIDFCYCICCRAQDVSEGNPGFVFGAPLPRFASLQWDKFAPAGRDTQYSQLFSTLTILLQNCVKRLTQNIRPNQISSIKKTSKTGISLH